MDSADAEWGRRILAAQAENAGHVVVNATGWTAVPLDSVHVDVALPGKPTDVVTYVAEAVAQRVHLQLQHMIAGAPLPAPTAQLVPLLSDLLGAWDDLRREAGSLSPAELEERRTGLLERTARLIAPSVAGPTGPVGPSGPPGVPPPIGFLRYPSREELDQAAGLVSSEPQLSLGGRCGPYGRARYRLEQAQPGTLPTGRALQDALVGFLALAFAAEPMPRWDQERVQHAEPDWQDFVIAAHQATEHYSGPQFMAALAATECPPALRESLVRRYVTDRELLEAYDDEVGA